MHQRSTHAQHDGDDIESDGFVRDTVAAIKQPIASSFPEILLLGRRHGLLRAAVLDGAARFHLDEHHSVLVVEHHKIQFAVSSTPVMAQCGPSFLLQPNSRISFAKSAELLG